MNYTFAQYRESADALQAKLGGFRPKVAMILGSGLGYTGDLVEDAVVVPYGRFPILNIPPPRDTKDSWSSAAWLCKTLPASVVSCCSR